MTCAYQVAEVSRERGWWLTWRLPQSVRILVNRIVLGVLLGVSVYKPNGSATAVQGFAVNPELICNYTRVELEYWCQIVEISAGAMVMVYVKNTA